MIAHSSPNRASFLSLCFSEETIDCGAVVKPTEVIDEVVSHDEYWDEMDMLSMSQIAKMVQLELTSQLDLFGVFVMEVVKDI